MMKAPDNAVKKIVGVDFFIESELLGSEIADKIQPHLASNQKLIMISNRGTMVWPSGSLFTECVDHYRVRVEGEMSQPEIFDLLSKLSSQFYIPSHEVLRNYDDRAGFSLAQGQ